MHDPTPEQDIAIQLGLRLSHSVLSSVRTVLKGVPDPEHVLAVALLHAAVRAEIQMRMKGPSSDEYRARFHDILDAVITHEERLAVVAR